MMLEIKLRLREVDKIVESNDDNIPNLKIEFCFLQFRKIIEQICFASILCDEQRYKDFRELEVETSEDDFGTYEKDWNARIILTKLKNISPHFMPIPIGNKKSANGQHHLERADVTATHNKLISMFKKCGEFMHIPKPFGEEYSVHINKQRQKYKAANKTIIGYSEYFKLLLWNHAAVGLEYEPTEKLDSLNNANPKNAWLINFGEAADNDIEIILAVAN
jgi:hypothetical protein